MEITISLLFDIVRMPVSQLTGRSRTAALAARGRDPAPGEADRADPGCARAGLPRSRHRPRGGEPAGQAEDSINGYRRSVALVPLPASRSCGLRVLQWNSYCSGL